VTRPTYVLGTGLSHDGSVCLLVDGVVTYAIEKERLTRVKHDGGNDRLAMEYVLDAAGITLEDVAVVVQNENFGMFRSGNTRYRGEPRMITDATETVTISHHLAHAYSAFGACPFDETAVLVVDGCGNAYEDCLDTSPGTLLGDVPGGLEHLYFEKDSYYSAAGRDLTTVAKDFSPWGARGWPVSPASTLHSLGGLYRAFSEYVFGAFDDAGKLMGLAPYGRLGRFEEPLFDLSEGRTFVRRESLRTFTTPALSRSELTERFEYFADVARWVQHELERALLYVVQDRYTRFASSNLAYAGGVALNAVANGRILRETGVERLFVQPAAGDNGLALGCAYYGWLQVLGRERVRPTGAIHLGRTYPRARVRAALDSVHGRVEVVEPASPAGINGVDAVDVVERTARLLAMGKVVGWYQGGAEFGPRALGHRSILAHPGIPGLRDHINRRIKFREDFRPFAPSVIAEEAGRFFDCEGYDSPYMILVFGVRTEWRERLCNVVHADGSARLHTVTRDGDPTYHRLLTTFSGLSGLPVLLNSSLNKRGMPIVETPEEALALFLDGDLDALVLDDTLVMKAPAVEPLSSRRVRGRIDDPTADDVPLVGARIRELSLVHDLTHRPERGLDDAPGRVVLLFTDTPDPLELAPDAYRMLELCDGRRTYASIALALGAETAYVLEFAALLSKFGILDHQAREHGQTRPAPRHTTSLGRDQRLSGKEGERWEAHR
jgi:carbamoyltransferase